MHALQVFEIAAMAIEVGLPGDPERGVAGDGVDVALNRRIADERSQGGLHQRALGKDAADYPAAYVEVSHPPASITLHSVPDALLHAEMRGVSTCLPDAVQQRIGGFERAFVLRSEEHTSELQSRQHLVCR